jgi:hypothetical protein
VGFVEAHRDDDAEKNRLCRPNPYPSGIEHWPRMVSRTWQAEQQWLREPDLARWMASTRLNLLRALPDHLAEPAVKTAVERYVTYVGAAIERLSRLTARPDSSRRGGRQGP